VHLISFQSSGWSRQIGTAAASSSSLVVFSKRSTVFTGALAALPECRAKGCRVIPSDPRLDEVAVQHAAELEGDSGNRPIGHTLGIL
jgi:hypothetical protein